MRNRPYRRRSFHAAQFLSLSLSLSLSLVYGGEDNSQVGHGDVFVRGGAGRPRRRRQSHHLHRRLRRQQFVRQNGALLELRQRRLRARVPRSSTQRLPAAFCLSTDRQIRRSFTSRCGAVRRRAATDPAPRERTPSWVGRSTRCFLFRHPTTAAAAPAATTRRTTRRTRTFW